ncbi:esterase/lipase family protein [Streptomyces sp. NPDC059456]|uniref:esterase/lipase family protein n=1 Tax=Streptomyces sp. NPDC059456 TaxID=3346838 RepID=UPI0036B96845
MQRPPARLVRRLCTRAASVALLLGLVVSGGQSAPRVENAAASGRAPRYDPQHAPVVFVAGGFASDLECGPRDTTPLSLWPGTAPTEADFETTWRPLYEDLALINTRGRNGRISSRTTASARFPLGCGSVPYRGGQAARDEPRAPNPTWCLPETTPVNPQPVACQSYESDVYSNFGLKTQQQIAADGRGQVFALLPYDWRLAPSVAGRQLQELVARLTAQTGVKATVIAHSQGNLVFREWMREQQEQGRTPGDLVGRFLSVAGPWWGTAESWTHAGFGRLAPDLAGEDVSLRAGLDNVRLTSQTSPGVYALMPNRSYDDHVRATTGGEHWLAVPSGSTSRWVPYEGVGRAVGKQLTLCPQKERFPCLNRELYEDAARAFPGPGFDTGGIQDFVAVVGAGVSTPLQICNGCTVFPDGSTDGTLVTVPIAGRISQTNGDSRVPVFSAIQGDDPSRPPGARVPFYFTCGITHTALMNNADVLAQTVPYITGDAPLSYGSTFSTTACSL